MTEAKIYIRLIAQPPRFVGESKYRPGEGWIDVRSYSVNNQDPGGSSRGRHLNVMCGFDRVMTVIINACQDGEHIRSGELVYLKGNIWVRYVMDHVMIAEYAFSKPGEEEAFSFVAEYQKLTIFSYSDSRRAG